MKLNIRLLYLYLFAFVGLLIVVIGSIQLVDLGLKVWVFKGADTYEYARSVLPEREELSREEEMRREEEEEERQKREQVRQRQRQVSNAVAMMVVGAPLYWFHWRTIERERV